MLDYCQSDYVNELRYLFALCTRLFLLVLLDSQNQTYTVEEAVEKLGFGAFQLIVTVFSGLLWVGT